MLKIFCLIVNVFVFSAFADTVKVQLKNTTTSTTYVDIFVNNAKKDFIAIISGDSFSFDAKNGDTLNFFIGDQPAHSHKKNTGDFKIINNSRYAEFTINSGGLSSKYSVTVNQK